MYTGNHSAGRETETGEQMTQVERLLDQLIAWAQTQPEILALYLYGSQAEGRANALSDVDVAVLVRDDLPQQQLWQLEERCCAQ